MLTPRTNSPKKDSGEIPQAMKDQVKQRDGYCCSVCGSTNGLDVHHVRPKRFGGSHEPSNLITLCRKCHTLRHIDLQLRLGERAILRMDSTLRRFLAWASRKNKPVQDYSELVKLLTGQPMFRPGQREIVDAVMAGRDVLVIRPTGSGKSLCYQLPALLKEKPTLVIAPLIAYMRDQVKKLHERGVPATFLCGDLDADEKESRTEYLKRGCFRIFYLAPEGLDSEKVRIGETLTKRFSFPVGMIVVDEADLIPEWGETFRPSFLRLAEVRRSYGNPQVLAFTATAPPKMREDIARNLEMEDPLFFDQGSDRPNVVLATRTVEASEGKEEDAKLELVKWVLSLRSRGSKVVVFVPIVKTGKWLEKQLKDAGFDCDFYYARLGSDVKANLQDRFMGQIAPPLTVLIATPAFSRGVDVPDIRFVIHWSAPATLAHYYQDVGRAGRDGKPALALLLRCPGDEERVWKLCEKSIRDTGKQQEVPEQVVQERIAKYQKEHKTVLHYVARGKEVFACQRRFLMQYFGYLHSLRSWPARFALWLTRRVETLPICCCSSCNWLFDQKRLEWVIRRVDAFEAAQGFSSSGMVRSQDTSS